MEKVDVLGVIDDAFSFCAVQNSGPTYNEMRQARATVAELINSAALMNLLAKKPVGGVSQSMKRAIVDRMDAALARIGGAA